MRHEIRIAPDLEATLLDRQRPELHEIVELALCAALVEIAAADLQGILEKVIERGSYDLDVDYGADPVPPLDAETARWARGLISGSAK